MSDIHTVRALYFNEVKPLLQELENRERRGDHGEEAARIARVIRQFERLVWLASGEDPDGVGQDG